MMYDIQQTTYMDGINRIVAFVAGYFTCVKLLHSFMRITYLLIHEKEFE